jgi:hypothetical protein
LKSIAITSWHDCQLLQKVQHHQIPLFAARPDTFPICHGEILSGIAFSK